MQTVISIIESAYNINGLVKKDTILETNVLSPAVFEGMLTPNSSTLQKVVESSFPPSRSLITDPSVVEDTNIVVEKEIEEQT